MLGASLAFYGMFLRPLMYETLWFAGVYEWLAVLALAYWAMTQARSLLRPYVESVEAAPISWSGWNRHQQLFETRPDPRLGLLERWQRNSLNPGGGSTCGPTSLDCCAATGHLLPLRARLFGRCATPWVPGSGVPFWRGGRRREEQNRRQAIGKSLENIEGAFSVRSVQLLNANDPTLPDLVGPYVETGEAPEVMASAIITAYYRQGADLDIAMALWFPIVNHVESGPRWFVPPWVRSRNRRLARDRRERLVEAAMAHLAGEATLYELPVAVVASRLPTFFLLPARDPGVRASDGDPDTEAGESQQTGPAYVLPVGSTQTFDMSRLPGAPRLNRSARPQTWSLGSSVAGNTGTITAGQGLEIIAETERAYVVRTATVFQTQIFKSSLRRQPVLPGDEIEAAE